MAQPIAYGGLWYVVQGRSLKSLSRRAVFSTRPIAVPGMPIGSPGMEQGGRKDPYKVVLFYKSGKRVFAEY